MYKNFRTKKEYLISNKLYFNNRWFLEKEIISTWCFHPIFRELVNFKIHIGELFPENYEILCEDYADGKLITTKKIISLGERLEAKYPYFTISERNFECELKKYLPNPSENSDLYIFIECFRKDIKLPDYYSLILFDNEIEFESCSINRNNNSELYSLSSLDRRFFEKAFEHLISDFCIKQGIGILDKINTIFNSYYLQNKFSIQQLNDCLSELYGAKENIAFMYGQTLNVIDSFLDELRLQNKALRCQHCGRVMSYAPTKKYCSLNVDGLDCGKKARNGRNYQLTKLKNKK